MLCLHGKPAVTATSENGFTFWFCGEPSGCFACCEEDAPLYDQGIKAFLAVNQERPKCCTITGNAVGERWYANFRVLTGKEKDEWWSDGPLKKENVGRPIFTCGSYHRWDSRGCGYVEWEIDTLFQNQLIPQEKRKKIKKILSYPLLVGVIQYIPNLFLIHTPEEKKSTEK